MGDHSGADLLRSALAAVERGDLDAAARAVAPDFTMHHAGAPAIRGREVWLEGTAAMRTAFPDLKIEILDLVEQGDLVAVRVRLSGSHRGEWFGAPPTGRSVDYVSHEFYRVSGDVLTEEWICSDVATMTSQLAGEAPVAG